jgi:hypothetical protein
MSAIGPFPTGLITVWRWNPAARQTTAEGRHPPAVSGLSASDAAIRPPRDHELAVVAHRQLGRPGTGQAAGEVQRSEQVRAAAVGHLGLPVGNHHRDAQPSRLGGQRPEDIPLVHADAVPQQCQRRRPSPPGPVDIRQLPQSVVDAPLDQNVPHACTIHHPSRLQRSPIADASQTPDSKPSPRKRSVPLLAVICSSPVESARECEDIFYSEDFSCA